MFLFAGALASHSDFKIAGLLSELRAG